MLRDHGFGVWKLWDEITHGHDSFLFEFGCGLGVLEERAVTAGDCSIFRKLFGGNESRGRPLMSLTRTRRRRSRFGARLEPIPSRIFAGADQFLRRQLIQPSRIRYFRPIRAETTPTAPWLQTSLGTGSRHIQPASVELRQLREEAEPSRDGLGPVVFAIGGCRSPKSRRPSSVGTCCQTTCLSRNGCPKPKARPGTSSRGGIRFLPATASGACSERRTRRRDRTTKEHCGSRPPGEP